MSFDTQVQVYVASALLVMCMALFKSSTPSNAPVVPEAATPVTSEVVDTAAHAQSPAPSTPKTPKASVDGANTPICHDITNSTHYVPRRAPSTPKTRGEDVKLDWPRRSTAPSPPRPIALPKRAISTWDQATRDQAATRRTEYPQQAPRRNISTFAPLTANPPTRTAINRTQSPPRVRRSEPRGQPPVWAAPTEMPPNPTPQSSETTESLPDTTTGARLPHEPLPAVAYRSFPVPGYRRPVPHANPLGQQHGSQASNFPQPSAHHAPLQVFSAPRPLSRLSRSAGLPSSTTASHQLHPRPIHMRRINAAPLPPTWNPNPPPPSQAPAHPSGTGFLVPINPSETDPATYSDMIARPAEAQREFQRFQQENGIPPTTTWHGRIALADALEVIRYTAVEDRDAADEGRTVDESVRTYPQAQREWAYWIVNESRTRELERIQALRAAGLLEDDKPTGSGTRDDPMVIDDEECEDQGEVVQMGYLDIRPEDGSPVAEWQHRATHEPPVHPIDATPLSPAATPMATEPHASFARPSPPPADAWDGTVRRTARTVLKRKREDDETEKDGGSDDTAGEDSTSDSRPTKRVRFIAEDAVAGEPKDQDLSRYRMLNGYIAADDVKWVMHKKAQAIVNAVRRHSPRLPPRTRETLNSAHDFIRYRERTDEELLQAPESYRVWENRRRMREANEEIRRQGLSTPNISNPLFTVGRWLPLRGEVPEEVVRTAVDEGELSSAAADDGDGAFEIVWPGTTEDLERHQFERVRYSMHQRATARTYDAGDESTEESVELAVGPEILLSREIIDPTAPEERTINSTSPLPAAHSGIFASAAELLDLQRVMYDAPAPALDPVLPADTAAAMAYNAANQERLQREAREQEEDIYADDEPTGRTTAATPTATVTTAIADSCPSSPASPVRVAQEDTESVGEEQAGVATRASERMNEDTHRSTPPSSPRGRSTPAPLLPPPPVRSVLGRRKRSRSPTPERPFKRVRIASPSLSPESERLRIASPRATILLSPPPSPTVSASDATTQPTKPAQPTVVDDSAAHIQPAGSPPAETAAEAPSHHGTSTNGAPTVRRSARIVAVAAAAAAAAEAVPARPSPAPGTTRTRRASAAVAASGSPKANAKNTKAARERRG